MTICYRCDYNLAFSGAIPKTYCDEDGNKPCAECLLELQALEEQDDEDDCHG